MFSLPRHNRLLVLASVLSLLLAHCSLSPAPTPSPASSPAPAGPARGGVYTYAQTGDAVSFQPLLTNDSNSSTFQSFVYDILFEQDFFNKGAPKPNMAESYAFSEDGMTLTVRLRQGMLWSDGTPITADDVLYTFQQRWKQPNAQLLRDTFKSLEASDAQTLVYRLTRPDCTAVLMANLRPLPKHIFDNQDIATSEYNLKPPVSSGAFILQEWLKDDHATFVANETYWRGRPNLDKVVIRIVKDINVSVALFKTQDVDITMIPPGDWDAIRQLPFTNAGESISPTPYLLYIGVKASHPFLQDKRVRQALAYALDKKGIVDSIYLGHAMPLDSFSAENHWAYTPDVTRYDFSPDKARALLKEAGWTPATDGILVKDGKPFKLRIHYPASMKQFEQVAVIAQQQWREIGVAIELNGEEFTANMQRLSTTFDFDLYVMSSFAADPHGVIGFYSAGNRHGYSNPQIDRLRTEAVTVAGCGTAERQKVYAQIQKIVTEDVVTIFLAMPLNTFVANNRLENGWDSRVGATWPIEKWYVKPKK